MMNELQQTSTHFRWQHAPYIEEQYENLSRPILLRLSAEVARLL